MAGDEQHTRPLRRADSRPAKKDLKMGQHALPPLFDQPWGGAPRSGRTEELDEEVYKRRLQSGARASGSH